MKKKQVILDVDTGIDDAVAICMATYSDKLNIKLITTICGNLNVGAVTKNTLDLLQSINRQRIPVAIGANKPLDRPRDTSIQAHGKKGLGKYEFPTLDLKPIKTKAVPKMYEILMKSNEKIIIAGLGPLTNIAKLLKSFPDCKEKIEYILISAGLLHDNPDDPYIGFNVMQDPEAVEIILKSGVPIIICPSDHGHNAYLNYNDIDIIRNTNKTGDMLATMFESYKDRHVHNGAATHDPCAVTFISNPEIFKTKKMYVHVRYIQESEKCVLDFDKRKKPNVLVVTKIKVKKFKKLFFNCLNKMP